MKTIFTGVLTVIISSVFAQAPTNGLLAYYPFSGNANDASGHANHGIVNGATLTADRLGNINSAYNFNGIMSNIYCGNTIDPAQFTLAAWIAVGSHKAFNTILYKGVDAGPIKNFEFRLTNTGFDYNYGNGNTYEEFQFPMALALGDWYHVANTYDGTKYCLYVNGVLTSTNTTSTIYASDNSGVYIGSRDVYNSSSLNYVFNGLIDEVYIYDRALTPTEITSMYSGTPVTTGIEDYNDKQELPIYPNPANDFINVSGDLVTITDVLGNIIYNGNSGKINVSYFTEGVYSCTISEKCSSVSKRLIIAR